MTEILRFGLIGCGRVAPRHADSIKELPGATLTAVCDVIDERAGRFASTYGAKQYNDYRRLLEDETVDVVNICTPSGLHAEIGIEAAQAGKHIVVEKPIALSTKDADRLIQAADEAGVKLCVVLQNRYNPPVQELYQLTRSGGLGKLLLGNATVRWYRPQQYYEDGWHGTLTMDGGALMNQSIHHIDALQWLMGDNVESVFAYTGTLAHRMEAEDVGVAIWRFANGALASIEGSTITYPKNLEGSVALFGEKGSVKVGGTALNRKEFWKVDGQIDLEREILTQEQLDPPSVYGYSHKLVLQDMVQAILNNREPQTNGSEGRKSVVLVTAMYESVATGEPVIVSERMEYGSYAIEQALSGSNHRQG